MRRHHLAPGRAPVAPELPRMQLITDDELIETLVEFGMPRGPAQAVRHNPQQRFSACRFWADVQDMNKGDKQAKERVDYCREAWGVMRKLEIISDDPTRIL